MSEIEEAVARVAEVIRARVTVPEEVLIGLEQLRGVVGKWLSAMPATLYVPSHGRWFVAPSGAHVDLTKRPTMRRIVTALVEARLHHAGASLTSAALIEAGWPEDPAVSEASTNRLRVTLCRLRHLGLDLTLLTTGEGWMLDPEVPVVREPEAAPIATSQASEPPSGVYAAEARGAEAPDCVPLAS